MNKCGHKDSCGCGSSETPSEGGVVLYIKEDGTIKNTAPTSIIDFTGNVNVTELSAGNIEVEILGSTPVVPENIYYVSKSYTGIGAVLIDGYTLADISSTNASYTAQLANAVVGDISKPFPCPFSARNALLDDLASFTVDNGLVKVLAGDWTIGSNVSSENGDINGNDNTNTVADIQFDGDVLSLDYGIGSFYQHNVNYEFTIGAGVTYINFGILILLGFLADVTDQYFKSGIFGKGYFRQVYGEINSLNNTLAYIDNARAELQFHCDELTVQQTSGFIFGNTKRVIIRINKNRSTDTTLFALRSTREGDALVSSFDIEINEDRFGLGYSPYPDSTDFWYHFELSNMQSSRKKQIRARISNIDCQINPSGLIYASSSGGGIKNLDCVIDIKNILQVDSGYNTGTLNRQGLIWLWCAQGANKLTKNSNIIINIGNADTQSPIISTGCNAMSITGSLNNRFEVNVGKHIKSINPFATRSNANIVIGVNGGSSLSPRPFFKINGGFINSEQEVVAGDGLTNNSCMVTLTGRFETTQASSVPIVLNLPEDKCVAVVDAILLGGASSDSIKNAVVTSNPRNGSIIVANRSVYIANVNANHIVDATIIEVGSPVIVSSDIKNYL